MKHHQSIKEYPYGLHVEISPKGYNSPMKYVVYPSIIQWLNSRGGRTLQNVEKDEKGKYILMNLKPVKVYLPERYQ